MSHDHDDHKHGLEFDLEALAQQQLRRRGVLALLGGGSVAALVSAYAPGALAAEDICVVDASETAGPYPGDGSNAAPGNTSNILSESGVVRSDIRSSFGTSTNTAEGVLLTLKIKLGDAGDGCAALPGYAIYVWHCTNDGRYSLYTAPDENYLRGVQVAGEDGYVTRVLQTWGIDGHNSHTNVCSSSARVGYALWSGADRPSPDHANAKFILLLSSHLETGHYFNPHAQRIIEGKREGAKICVIDVRLSNTASMADWWLAPYPGTEALLLLAIAHVLLHENLFDLVLLSAQLVRSLTPASQATAIVRGVIALGEGVGARVIAAGVDGDEPREILSDLGCLYGIGEALAPAMPIEHLLPWLGGRLAERM